MVDWDEISRTEDEKRLKEAKLWLFQENVRLENERRELEQSREKFLSERVRFKKELEEAETLSDSQRGTGGFGSTGIRNAN